jgi:hypothetical protein
LVGDSYHFCDGTTSTTSEITPYVRVVQSECD